MQFWDVCCVLELHLLRALSALECKHNVISRMYFQSLTSGNDLIKTVASEKFAEPIRLVKHMGRGTSVKDPAG
jgi:hypothetical protein